MSRNVLAVIWMWGTLRDIQKTAARETSKGGAHRKPKHLMVNVTAKFGNYSQRLVVSTEPREVFEPHLALSKQVVKSNNSPLWVNVQIK